MPIMARETLIAIGAGLASAMLSIAIAFGSGLGFILAYFALLPILLVGLSDGLRSASIASLVGIVAAIILTNIFQGALFAASVALPSWVIVRYALMQITMQDGSKFWLPIGELVARLAALGGILVALSAVTYFDAPGGLSKTIENFLNDALLARLQFNAPTDRELLISHLVPFFPAIAASSWILMTLINSSLAQLILTKAGRNLRPPIQYSSITVPDWIFWTAVGAAALALIGSGNFEYAGRNIVAVLSIPFFLVGLSTVHTLTSLLRSPRVALFAFYFFMIISSWVIFIAAVIGFFEPWTKLRERFVKLPDPDEDE